MKLVRLLIAFVSLKQQDNCLFLQILIAGLIAVASAAKLGNNYLPPHSAKTAGGSGSFLNAPFGGSGFKSSASVHGGYASPKSAEGGAAILRFNNDNNGDGSYQFE